MRARAIVDSQRLTQNLSQSAFVRDEAWHELIDEVLREQLDGVLAQVIAELLGHEDGGLVCAREEGARAEWIDRVFEDTLSRASALRREKREVPEVLRELMGVLERYPYWWVATSRTVEGINEQISTAQVRHISGGRAVLPTSSRHFPGLDIGERGPVLRIWREPSREHHALAGWLGMRLESWDDELERLLERRRNERTWRARPKEREVLAEILLGLVRGELDEQILEAMGFDDKSLEEHHTPWRLGHLDRRSETMWAAAKLGGGDQERLERLVEVLGELGRVPLFRVMGEPEHVSRAELVQSVRRRGRLGAVSARNLSAQLREDWRDAQTQRVIAVLGEDCASEVLQEAWTGHHLTMMEHRLHEVAQGQRFLRRPTSLVTLEQLLDPRVRLVVVRRGHAVLAELVPEGSEGIVEVPGEEAAFELVSRLAGTEELIDVSDREEARAALRSAERVHAQARGRASARGAVLGSGRDRGVGAGGTRRDRGARGRGPAGIAGAAAFLAARAGEALVGGRLERRRLWWQRLTEVLAR